MSSDTTTDHEHSPTTTGRLDDPDWVDLSAFQRDLLVAIVRRNASDAKPHGLGVKSRLEEIYGESINHGRLYPNLDDLVAAGLVTKYELDRRTNGYELTDAARDMLAARASELSALPGVGTPTGSYLPASVEGED